MTRFRLGARTVAIATLVAASLAIVPPAGARTGSTTPHHATSTRPGGGRPDPGFGPTERRAEMNRQQRLSNRTGDQLRLGAKQQLVVKDVLRDVDGTLHVRYDRTYAGLPVVGGDMIVERAPDGDLQVTRATNARIKVDSTLPRLSPGNAKALAAARNPGQAAANSPVRVVFAADHKPVLAWQTTVTGTKPDGTPIHDLIYTDASTGKQLARFPQVMDAIGHGKSLYSGTVAINTEPSGSSYRLVDNPRGGHQTYDKQHRCCSGRGTLFTDHDNNWGNGTTSSGQSAAVDAAYGAAQTWDFYQDRFGRNGIRDDGHAAYSRVHFRNHYDNAFWSDSCFCMSYGDGNSQFRPLVELDVAAHEMTHGVTAATAGLIYEGEAGGLNESTSDVMGTMVEFAAKNSKDPGDYLLGEKIAKQGGYLRRMDNPKADGHSANCWFNGVGNRDVHYSSGVGNHLFYLLSEGTGTRHFGGRVHRSTTCHGESLPSGIGRSTAAAIWYRALTTYWTSTTNYHRAANGMVKAARDLYGNNSTQCNATVKAWKGVNLTPDESCAAPADDPSNLLQNPGFEQGKVGWTATPDVISDIRTAHTGTGLAYLDGYGETHTDTVSQQVTIPAAGSAELTFYLDIATDEDNKGEYDNLQVQVKDSSGTYSTVARFSNLDSRPTYQLESVDLSSYVGQTVDIRFRGHEDNELATDFLLDDLALRTS